GAGRKGHGIAGDTLGTSRVGTTANRGMAKPWRAELKLQELTETAAEFPPVYQTRINEQRFVMKWTFPSLIARIGAKSRVHQVATAVVAAVVQIGRASCRYRVC